MRNGRGEVPFDFEAVLGGVHLVIGQPEQWMEECRAQLARGRDTHTVTSASLVMALAIVGSHDEAMAAATGLIDAAGATRNPWVLSYALLAYGLVFRDTDPARALEALRRGLVIAQDCGSRANESYLAHVLARLEAEHGDPLAAFDYLTLAIRNIHDSGNAVIIRPPWLSSPPFLTGSDASRRQPPSPVSRSVPSPRRRPLKSPPLSPTSAMSSATRPTNRSPARARR